ncbi:branched-chain amino acid aminotransferase [Fusarium agapanthi]|uniref:Branched-chain amino acid aminotransferase n=1 Tax=Fusarium agapanthi TaxID=1803897 RepID=A0A9P5BDV7_9HYPO|nr:branched-chain amino acid aminotransferase [Fusarium agapanthi]
MCTYSFQRMVCCCAKGPECPQMTRGRAIIGGEAFHYIDMFYAVDDLGSACDYQRRLFGRNAGPTMHCPRYAFDDKRIIKGSFRKSELACVKCAETCAPPSCSWQAPRAEGKEEGR